MRTESQNAIAIAAPLRRVIRRETHHGRTLAHDVLACGHRYETLRYAKAYPYRHCAACVAEAVIAHQPDRRPDANGGAA